jgi:AGZA family xanthine/uracil permease-like MFS transporter
MDGKRLFSDRDVNLRTELIAGVTSFLTSSYIIAVNPAILSGTGMDHHALIAVTCIASGLATLLMAVWPKVPVLMAPGMGLNAFFAFTVVKQLGYSWQQGLGFVFWAGLLFLVLSLLGFRQKIASAIPVNLRLAGSVGIGLFIAYLGFHNLSFWSVDDQGLLHLARLDAPKVLGLCGLALMGFLEARRVKGSLLVGILVVTIASMILGYANVPQKWVSAPPSILPLAGQMKLLAPATFTTVLVVFTFLYVALFDGLGTLIAVSEAAGISREQDYEKKFSRMLTADSMSNMAGAALGTSTVTAYIESATGISQGGRSGWTSFFSAVLFFGSLFLVPFVAAIPNYATAPALIMVGVFMIR